MSFNYSILSYNKIEEIEEYKPISPPSSSSSLSSENNDNNKIFYYTFYLQTKYKMEQNDINYIYRSYSSPSLILLTNNNNHNNNNNNIITSSNIITNNNIIANNKKKSDNNMNNMNNNFKLNDKKDKNIIKLYNQKSKDETNKKIKTKNNNNMTKIKKLLYNKNGIAQNNDSSRNKKKNSSKHIDSSNITLKNENLKNRVEFDNQNQKINIYIKNNIFNVKINNNNNSIDEGNNKNITIENKINNYTSKKSIKTPIEDSVIKKYNVEKYIPMIKNNKLNNTNNVNNIIDKKLIKNIYNDKKINNLIKYKIQNINIVNNNNDKIVSLYKNKNLKNIDNNTLNNNTINNKISLKLSQLQKVLKKNGLFNILTFLEYKDIINILEIKNRKLKLLLNKCIFNAYYLNIRKHLKLYHEFLEVLKYNIIYSKIKNLLKIDLMITIRFIDKKNKIALHNPRHFQLIYLYEYLKKNKNNNKLYDCYGFDLFCDNKEKEKNIDSKFTGIYLSKQITLFGNDKNDELINIQPILPFKINDKGIFNLVIYTSNDCFINPSNLQIKLKSKELNKNIKELENKNINNIRINEYEYICKHWKKTKTPDENKKEIQSLKIVKNIIRKWFEPYFIINDIFYDNIGISIYKFHLTANKCGILINNNINIKIIIKEPKDFIENEVKKNYLLFERRGVFEVRRGDHIIFYLSMKEIKF